MSTNFHTPIATGAAANAATVNAPLGTLDAAINTLDNAKVSKVYESDGGGPAVQVTAGGNVMVGTSTDITGATLQVAGGVVVSDGAGTILAILNQDTIQRTGINWTIRSSAADNNWYGVCYGNGLFVAVANTGAGNRVMTSPDGVNWTIRSSAADNQWRGVCYGNGLFVAVASTGTGNRVMTSGFQID